jgi:hypothetical protein
MMFSIVPVNERRETEVLAPLGRNSTIQRETKVSLRNLLSFDTPAQRRGT